MGGPGLAIMHRLVAAMGGETGLESEPGEGVLFWFRLPLPKTSRPTGGQDAPALSDFKANNGREAVKMGELGTFFPIVTDNSIPEMDGIEAPRMIRASSGTNWTTPVVTLTAHAFSTVIARFGEAGSREMARDTGGPEGPRRAFSRGAVAGNPTRYISVSPPALACDPRNAGFRPDRQCPSRPNAPCLYHGPDACAGANQWALDA